VTHNAKSAWTNASVLRFAGDADPVAAVVDRARQVVLHALDEGWAGPPFDPLALAELLKLEVTPREDVRDARTLAAPNGRLRVEYNPNRSRGRVRYSIAHEIAHTLFEDCADRVRHRGHHGETESDGWQLEALCNIAASELLMPMGSLPKAETLELDALLQWRAKYDVSAEALFLRMVQVTSAAYAAFCASPTARAGTYRVDYVIGSPAWSGPATRGANVPAGSVVHDCTAIGFTAKADETWGSERLHVECVGLPPYPGAQLPRVLCLARPTKRGSSVSPTLTFLRGDATRPRGPGEKIVVQVVNDATPNWGGKGFSMAVLRRWPQLQDEFRSWANSTPRSLSLGRMHVTQAEPDTQVASLVAQRGYGPSASPRIRYGALKSALEQLAKIAVETRAAVHMPRIGCGQAGGSWDVVEELLTMTLGAARIPICVYDPPGTEPPVPPQQSLKWTPN
jgi:O-acetyl-ADP-ribose deacetylase (regulator of RNase III)